MNLEVENFFKSLQDEICKNLEKADGSALFREDVWRHGTGGGGRTRILQNGNVIEKGGVNFSAVSGPVGAGLVKQLGLTESRDVTFFATGVSIVQHPVSPLVPIIHMNVRYFELSDGTCWFGGGIDLTPHYVDEKDAAFFHQSLRDVCAKHGPEVYDKFKAWADDYFYISHRDEMRGIGGIFFDHLRQGDYGLTKKQWFEFVKDVGRSFVPIYSNLIDRHKGESYGEAEKQWQLLRRGRYAEFNLILDRGTRFGLETGGRTESILMSLPPLAQWTYDFTPKDGSPEARTLGYLKKGLDWV